MVVAIKALPDGSCLRSDGLEASGFPEIELPLHAGDRLEDSKDLLSLICDWVLEKGLPAEREFFPLGFWAVYLKPGLSDNLIVMESSLDGQELIPGASFTTTLWFDQHALNRHFDATYTPSFPVDFGLFHTVYNDLDEFTLTRYMPDGSAAGWMLLPFDWDNDMSDVHMEHTIHLVQKRPHVAKFLALPVGYWVQISGSKYYIEYDETLTTEEPEDEGTTSPESSRNPGWLS